MWLPLPLPRLVTGAVSKLLIIHILHSLHLFNEHLHSTYNVPGTVSFANINSHTYLTTLWEGYYYFTNFTDKETEVINKLAKGHTVSEQCSKMWVQVV